MQDSGRQGFRIRKSLTDCTRKWDQSTGEVPGACKLLEMIWGTGIGFGGSLTLRPHPRPFGHPLPIHGEWEAWRILASPQRPGLWAQPLQDAKRIRHSVVSADLLKSVKSLVELIIQTPVWAGDRSRGRGVCSALPSCAPLSIDCFWRIYRGVPWRRIF